MVYLCFFCFFNFWRNVGADILSELFPVWDLCVCRTPATMESGQKRCVGRCWDFIFFAFGAGSGLLASNIGWRIRRRAFINLWKQEGGWCQDIYIYLENTLFNPSKYSYLKLPLFNKYNLLTHQWIKR